MEVVIILDFHKVIIIDECGWVMRCRDEGFFDEKQYVQFKVPDEYTVYEQD